MSEVRMGDAVRINCDGTWTIDPKRCIAYPDDESAYTGCLDIDGGLMKLQWVKGQGFINWIDVRFCVGDMVYEAVQCGLVPVGVRTPYSSPVRPGGDK